LVGVDDAPIGIFDSGFGGLTVARAIMAALPGESILYLGDQANAPYGPRPVAQVRALALAALGTLASEGVKVLVIACNSASAAVLADARERFAADAGTPVVEVVHPAVRAAARATRNGRVGVIGTRATIESGAYADAFAAAPDIVLTTRACPRFVEFVEAGRTEGPEVLAAAHTYLDPFLADGVDTLVLGCTHYPLLAGVIAQVMGERVELVSSGPQTAREVAAVLTRRDGLSGRPPAHRWCTTGDPVGFAPLAARFLAHPVHRAELLPRAGGAPSGRDARPGAAGAGRLGDGVRPSRNGGTAP
jgi:glutamate racemase